LQEKEKMFKSLVCGAFVLLSGAAFASTTTVIPSQNYVDSVNEDTKDYVDRDKVSVSETANQELKGVYTVVGSLDVPTQPLPASVARGDE
jgi:hypothetical protein